MNLIEFQRTVKKYIGEVLTERGLDNLTVRSPYNFSDKIANLSMDRASYKLTTTDFDNEKLDVDICIVDQDGNPVIAIDAQVGLTFEEIKAFHSKSLVIKQICPNVCYGMLHYEEVFEVLLRRRELKMEFMLFLGHRWHQKGEVKMLIGHILPDMAQSTVRKQERERKLQKKPPIQ